MRLRHIRAATVLPPAQPLQRAQAIMREPKRRKHEDEHVQPDRHHRDERKQHDHQHGRHPQQRRHGAEHAANDADCKQRQAMRAKDRAALVGARVPRERIVGHHTVGQPAPQQRRDHGEQRRHQPQRDRDDQQHHTEGRGKDRVQHAAEQRAAAPRVKTGELTCAKMANHRGHRYRGDQQQHGQHDQRHRDRDDDKRSEHHLHVAEAGPRKQ
ncbi:hypothetical protein DFQ30_000455 [Apophysomyces sp. BC1015]|nr:hypothetical protein DFQ30_000455 [Apophysomyces sp. BC1015]